MIRALRNMFTRPAQGADRSPEAGAISEDAGNTVLSNQRRRQGFDTDGFDRGPTSATTVYTNNDARVGTDANDSNGPAIVGRNTRGS